MHALARHIRAHLWVVFLLAFLGVFFFLQNASLPMVGDDYRLNFSRLIAGKWHFVRQGIMPLRYTPHFCGGIPQYGYPQDTFYSLPQFLFFFTNDIWMAVQVSALVLMVIGYAGWWLLGTRVLHLTSPWAHLLALVMSASGHYLVHLLAGHMTFQSMALLGWVLFLLFEPRKERWQALLTRSALFGAVIAYMLYSGGILILMPIALLILLLVPFFIVFERPTISFLRAFSWRALSCGATSLVLCASKIVAVLSFIRFFPRLVPFTPVHADSGSWWYLLGSLWAIPQVPSLFKGAAWGLEEHSNFVSPITIVGLAAATVLLWCRCSVIRAHPLRSAAIAGYVLLLVLLFEDFAAGEGMLIELFHRLPVFSSLHVSTRFLFVCAVFIVLVSIRSLAVFVQESLPRWESTILIFSSLVTVAAVPIAYLPLYKALPLKLPLPFVQEILQTYNLSRPVRQVAFENTEVVNPLLGATSLMCYVALHPFGTDPSFPLLYEGEVSEERSGFFNLRNPACFQYPRENHCKPGDLIAVSDRENFERFVQGEPTTWRISLAQRIADAVSLVSLVAWVIVLVLLRRQFLVEKVWYIVSRWRA